jgi:hypothetical protein
MTDTLCYYDANADYDSDVYWNGDCTPEVLPVESLIRIGGRAPKRTKKIFCYVDINTLSCVVNGVDIPLESINSRKISHVSEEDEKTKTVVLINSITVKKGSSDKENPYRVEVLEVMFKEQENEVEVGVDLKKLTTLEKPEEVITVEATQLEE